MPKPYDSRITTETQVSHRGWVAPGGFLGSVLEQAQDRVAELLPRRSEMESAARAAPATPDLIAALRRENVAVIAEMKRRSPSKGAINATLSAGERAGAYERGGAAAISVLTEPVHFAGSDRDLRDAVTAVAIPVIRKDFHIHPVQLVEARLMGASAVLLIVRALPASLLQELMAAAEGLHLCTMLEVRTEEELEQAVRFGARVVGVNNRDLETLKVEPTISERLVPMIPPATIAVSESGVGGVHDVERAAKAGADAVLVGSVLSAAGDATEAVSALVGVPRIDRRG